MHGATRGACGGIKQIAAAYEVPVLRGENLARDQGLREFVLGGLGATLGWSRRSAPHDLAQLLRATDDEVSSYLATANSRAQHDGDLRGDFEVTDVQLVTATVQAAATLGQRAAPELHRRAAALVLDGLRAPRAGSSTLPAPALTRDQLEQLTERSGTDGRCPGLHHVDAGHEPQVADRPPGEERETAGLGRPSTT